jgi:hypothetical protein
MFSAVRCTDFVSVSTDPSDKSLGSSQPSAKRGLSKAFRWAEPLPVLTVIVLTSIRIRHACIFARQGNYLVQGNS